jgi:hypothetical protein
MIPVAIAAARSAGLAAARTKSAQTGASAAANASKPGAGGISGGSAASKALPPQARAANMAKNLAKETLSSLKHIEITDYLFVGMALSSAIIKDILDYTPLGLPGLSAVLTFAASFMIFGCMYIAGSSTSSAKIKASVGGPFKKYGALVAGSLAEMIIGIEFLPIETMVVIYMYWLVLRERQSAAQ